MTRSLKPLATLILVGLLFAPACGRGAAPRQPAQSEPGPVTTAPTPVTGTDTQPAPPPAPVKRCEVPAPAPLAGKQNVTIYFNCDEQVRPVVRQVPDTPEILRAALLELLKGPSEAERAAGFTSFFGDATVGKLQNITQSAPGRFTIDFVDFSAQLNNASTSAGSHELLSQLHATIFGVAGVQEAEIRFEGSCDRFWNWLQRGCEVTRKPA